MMRKACSRPQASQASTCFSAGSGQGSPVKFGSSHLGLGLGLGLALAACSESSASHSTRASAPSASASTLKTHVLGESQAKQAVFLLHGYGASGEDLVPIARLLSQDTPYRYVVVEAPLARAEGGRAWWPIDFAAQRARFEQGRGLDLRNEDPQGLPHARSEIEALLDAARRDPEAPVGRVALVGFSQGAMLTLDLALESPKPPACVGLLSGTFLRETRWRERLSQSPKFEVFLSHGTEDTILPFALSEELHRALVQHALPTTFVPFAGGHSIPRGVLAKLKSFLEECLGQ